MLILLKLTATLPLLFYILNSFSIEINTTLLSIVLGTGLASLPFLIIYSIKHNVERT